MCEARRYGAEMHCCCTIWEVGDEDIPPCKTAQQIGNETLERIKKELDHE